MYVRCWLMSSGVDDRNADVVLCITLESRLSSMLRRRATSHFPGQAVLCWITAIRFGNSALMFRLYCVSDIMFWRSVLSMLMINLFAHRELRIEWMACETRRLRTVFATTHESMAGKFPAGDGSTGRILPRTPSTFSLPR